MFPNHREWERTENLGALPRHCYFIPCAEGDIFDPARRESSSLFESLNGEWEFRAHDRLETCELGEPLTGTIPVPSCVQLCGSDGMQYTNHRYPFPYDPPYIRKDIPAFHYRRTFTPKKRGARLVFEGVDAAFYVFVNGEFLGYRQISHMTSEFELSGVLREGENVLDVIVLKWCASSYLEDQDKWRTSGIFRDVYLLYRSEGCVEDYAITTRLLKGGAAEVTFSLRKGGACNVALDGKTVRVQEGKSKSIRIENASLWSAECPNLYDLTITCSGEVIHERVGIREMTIEKGVFLLNGAPIKLCGVNRHEFHPDRAAAITLEDSIRDLALMKEMHVNAIRTSHYPQMPAFYRLCDEYGFYVLDEADVECHGVVMQEGDYDLKKYNDLAKSPLYADAVCERVLSMAARDRNRPCVVMWSLGNESGYGPVFQRAALALKKEDATRPVHYEGHSNAAGTPEYYGKELDVASRMYPTVEWMKEFLHDKKEKRPLVLCEYSHAMGNSPGDIPAYWELIRSNDRFLGGFVWEWADHGVRTEGGIRYGGDFGESMHDDNFCIDGIVTPDRTVKAGTLEMKRVYQPVGFDYEKGTLTVTSRCYFRTIEGTLCVELVTAEGRTNVLKRRVSLAPQQKRTFSVSAPSRGFAGLAVSLPEEDSQGFFELKQTENEAPMPAKEVTISEGDLRYAVLGGGAELYVEKGNGAIYLPGCREPLLLSVMRAPIDNERNLVQEYQKLGVYSAAPYFTFEQRPNGLFARGGMYADAVRGCLDARFSVCPAEHGFVLTLDYSMPAHIKRLPAIGFRFAVEASAVTYLGYGGGRESYADMHACDKAMFTENVADQYFHYVRPQESGNHTSTELVRIGGWEIRASAPFDFSAIPYAARTLMATSHDDGLPDPDGTAYVFIGLQEGMGSNACGPALDARYRLPRTSTLKFYFKKL